ncbi:hypothetical protein [Actinophytocola algeriensis]|uniref:Uncharacterized protein n=1 Tax=Actinophytocola algeriensis TaxID=1768010 RepID=A0A7W7VFJ8_9PSEU|nr:hypothetical protein [Actinophytocola algeriensis]MBB4908413.1 hypothetical protein [Actinophytocola algeriensis]MBE1475200.1 hypothetical protein [Actinophytocola algeriensis]
MVGMIAAAAGGTLLAACWLSVARAVFTQGQEPPRAARWSIRLTAGALTPVAVRLGAARRERLLALCAPLALFLMFAAWFTGGTTGFVLLAVAAEVIRPEAGDIGAMLAFELAGPARLYAIAAAVSGALLVGVFAVYVARIAAAHGRREALVARLSAHAREPSDAERVIATYVRSDSRAQLDTWYGEWAAWLSDVRCTHGGHPSLVYFRSSGPLSWLEAAVIALDAAALVEATAPDWAPPNTQVLLETGAGCLQRIAAGMGIAVPRSVVSLHGREQRGFADTIETTLFAGLPVARTERLAWEVFQQERTRYAPYAAAVAARLQYGPDAGGTAAVITAEQSGGR